MSRFVFNAPLMIEFLPNLCPKAFCDSVTQQGGEWGGSGVGACAAGGEDNTTQIVVSLAPPGLISSF